MPPQYLRIFSSLQDSVPSKPFEDVLHTLKEELGLEEQSMFESIDAQPLSTASLAQVHRATLVGGRQVVIKAQHRGVASLMRQDMANLGSILSIVARFDKEADFGPVVKEWMAEVLKELDFRTEATNMAEVRALISTQGIRAIVPASVDELVTQRVLVMDYCEGFAIKDTAKLDAEGVDRELLLQRVCEAWAAQLHVAGVFNADPHPGNILVSTAGGGGDGGEAHDASVPVLLDFGLTKRFTRAQTVAFARLVHASEASDVDGLLQSFDEMGLQLNRYDPFEDMAAMRRSLSDTVPASEAKAVSKQRKAERNEEVAAKRAEESVPKGGKLRSPVDAWPPELVFFTRVTAMLRGLCSSLEVRHPYLSTMAGAARVTLREAIPRAEHATFTVYPTPRVLVSSALQRRLEAVAASLVVRGEVVGLQVAVRQHGEVLANVAAGTLGTADPRPVRPSSLFNVFSVSKVVLAMGVHLLLEDGSIRLDDPVAKHWPAFGAGGKGNVTVRHLLAHQAGLANAMPPAATLDELLDWGRMTAFLANATAEHAPGAETRYHYLTFAWACGGLIEAVTGRPYEQFLNSRLLEPALAGQSLSDELLMGGLPDSVETGKLAVLSMVGRNRDASRPGETSRRGETNATNGRTTRLAKYQGREQMLNPSIFNMRKVRAAKLPSANGHASAAALAAVLDVLGATYRAASAEGMAGNESRLFSAACVDEMRVDQRPAGATTVGEDGVALLDNAGAAFGLGVQVHEFVLSDGSKCRSIGHSGLGGSEAITLPEAGISFAFTTNTLSMDSTAKAEIVRAICEELGIRAPLSLLPAV